MSKLFIITSFNFFTHIKTALIAAGPVETSELFAKTIMREPERIKRIISRIQERHYQLKLIIPNETRYTNLMSGRALVERYLNIVYGADRGFLTETDVLSFNPEENVMLNIQYHKIKLIEQILQTYNLNNPDEPITLDNIASRVVIIDDDELFLKLVKDQNFQILPIQVAPAHQDLKYLEEMLGIILPKYDEALIQRINQLTAEFAREKIDFQFGSERLATEKLLQPLILQEYILKAVRDFVSLQVDTVKPFLNTLPTLAELDRSLEQYQSEAKTIFEDIKLNFKSYLISDRTHIFYGDNFLPLTKENIQLVLKDFTQHLIKIFHKYQNFDLSLTTDFTKLVKELKIIDIEKCAELEKIMFVKIDLTFPIACKEEDLKIQSRTNRELQSSFIEELQKPAVTTPGHTFLLACEQGNLERVKKCLPIFNKMNFINDTRNEQGEAALHIACRRGDVNLLTLLARYNADLNLPVWVPSQDGSTKMFYHPLQWALRHRQLTIIRLYLQWHINLQPTNNYDAINLQYQDSKYKSTILHTAIYECVVDAIQLLLNAGALINTDYADYQKWTPLHYAAHGENLSALKLILEQYRRKPLQIQVNAKGTEGETALGVAVRWNRPKAAQLIVEYGIGLDNEELIYLKSIASKPGNVHVINLLKSLLSYQLKFILESDDNLINLNLSTTNIKPNSSNANTVSKNYLQQPTQLLFFQSTPSPILEKKPFSENAETEEAVNMEELEEISLEPEKNNYDTSLPSL